MNKDYLHIFYDSNINDIKAEFTDELGKHVSSSAWKDVLSSLLINKEFTRKCEHNSLTVEYEGIIVRIDDWINCSKDPLVKQYISKNISFFQQKRKETVIEYNKKVSTLNDSKELENKSDIIILEDDEELIPEAISLAFKKRHQAAYNEIVKQNELMQAESDVDKIKVKRNNKYSKVITFIAGGLVIFALVNPNLHFSKELGTHLEETQANNDVFISSHEPTLSQLSIKYNGINHIEESDNTFSVGLDINDLFESPGNDNEMQQSQLLNYENRSQEDKARLTRTQYGDIIERCAKKCGIDPKIILGIATQESGNHEFGLRAGSKGGLMQIGMSYWRGKTIEYYDFEDREYYAIKITDENIMNVENNVLIGCAILQNELKMYNYNILLAIQSYNMGYGNMNKILTETSIRTGLNKVDIINNPNCLDWINYTNIVGVGDSNYVQNVLSWVGYGYDIYELSCEQENGTIKTCTTIPMQNNIGHVL